MNKNIIIIKRYYFYCILLIFCILFYLNCSFTPVSKKVFMSFGHKKSKKDDDKDNPDPFDKIIEIKSGNFTISQNGYFNFDTIEASKREISVTFNIYNNGNTDLILSGNPVISIDNNNDFKIDYSGLSNTISSNSIGSFSVKYLSTSYDGEIKYATITIINNFNNIYTFTISCTAKRSESILFLNSGGWISPCSGKAVIKLLGGGGGGGGSKTNGNGCGAGGGGSGWYKIENLDLLYGTIYTIVVGNGGDCGDGSSADDIVEPGGNGGISRFYGGSINFQANGGNGGGIPTIAGPGEGGNGQYPGKTPDLSNNNGGDGGNNISDDYDGFIYSTCYGKNSPGDSAYMGSGNGGAGGGDDNPGGDGGSGYVKIEWTGFAVP